MRCKVCGREAMNPEANFCDYCGSSFRQYGEGFRQEEPKAQETGNYSAFGTLENDRQELYGEESHRAGRGVGNVAGEEEKPVTIWTFLGVLLVLFVPYIGFYVFLGMLFYWAFASNISGVRKTFGRAMLIYAVIMLIFMMISLSVLMESGMFDSIFQQMGLLK